MQASHGGLPCDVLSLFLLDSNRLYDFSAVFAVGLGYILFITLVSGQSGGRCICFVLLLCFLLLLCSSEPVCPSRFHQAEVFLGTLFFGKHACAVNVACSGF